MAISRPRILIVDDHQVISDALRIFVEPEFEVVETFSDGRELLAKAPDLKPDIVVLDIGMPIMNGLTAGAELKKLLPKVKLIYLTMNRDRERAAEAFRLGASAYILKNAAGSELIKALREVMRGGYYASPALTEGIIGSFVQGFKKMKSPKGLTPRQIEFLRLFGQGMYMKDIASALKISVRTVAFHKYTIMQQFDIKSNAELVAFAIANQNPMTT